MIERGRPLKICTEDVRTSRSLLVRVGAVLSFKMSTRCTRLGKQLRLESGRKTATNLQEREGEKIVFFPAHQQLVVCERESFGQTSLLVVAHDHHHTSITPLRHWQNFFFPSPRLPGFRLPLEKRRSFCTTKKKVFECSKGWSYRSLMHFLHSSFHRFRL